MAQDGFLCGRWYDCTLIKTGRTEGENRTYIYYKGEVSVSERLGNSYRLQTTEQPTDIKENPEGVIRWRNSKKKG